VVQKAKETGTRDKGSVTNRKPKQQKIALPKKPKLAKLLTTPITDPVSTTAATTPPKPASKPCRTTKESYTVKKMIKTLREIAGRAGQGPIDYKEFTARIKVTINFIDLL
jgi:hypothetical protein